MLSSLLPLIAFAIVMQAQTPDGSFRFALTGDSIIQRRLSVHDEPAFGRMLDRIRRADGPARIAPEWWRGEIGCARDYWRLEDEEGGRFWLYGQAGGWYLHGLFA